MTAVATEVCIAFSPHADARGGQQGLHLLCELRMAASRVLSAASILVSNGERWLQEPVKVNSGWWTTDLLLEFSVFYLFAHQVQS